MTGGKMTELKNKLLKYSLLTAISGIILAGAFFGIRNYTEEKKAPKLKFAHISDTHFSRSNQNWHNRILPSSPYLLDEAIEKLNKEKDLKFIVFTGDLIDTSQKQLLEDAMAHLIKIEKPWYFSFGNHDRCRGDQFRKCDYLSTLSTINPYIKKEATYYSFSPEKGYKVMILDTISCDGAESVGKINFNQFQWIKKELANSGDDIVLLYSHMPVIPPYYAPHHILMNAFMVQELAEKRKNPIIFFSGHYHGARIYQRKNVLYVSSPALITYPNAFRFITITKMKDKAIVNIKMEQTNNPYILERSKKINYIAKLSAGTKRDQSGTYVLKYRK